jgi:hypothetical protein
MPLVPCRAAINLVGARAGERILVDPDDPRTALHIEKGYLVIDGDPAVEATVDSEPVAESGDGTSGEGDADETLDPGAAVGDDSEALLEPVSDSDDERTFPAA